MATIPAPPPGFIEEPQGAPAPPPGFVEPPAGFVEPASPQIGIASKSPSTLDYMRRLVFGGPEQQTVLGNALPSLSDYNSASKPNPASLPLIAPAEAIPSENQIAQGESAGQFDGISYIPAPAREVARGVGQAVGGLTTPENLGIMAATEGMGVLTPAKGYASVAAKAVQGALGAYFTYQMAHGATDATKQAYDAYQRGDYDTAARLAGYAGVNAFMAAMGIKHAVSNARGILKTQVPKPALKPTVLPAEETEQPEPIGAAPPPTMDVNAEPEGPPPPPPGFEEPAQEPQGFEKPEPVKPTQTPVVTPATPNPPTAAMPTVPEDPATIDMQMQQLTAGTRKVVMFPKGTPLLDDFPAGVRQTSDQFGNIYVYRPDLGVSPTIIKKAAKQNKLPEILGSTASGLGAPDKADLQGEPAAVTVHAPNGTEVQSTATDEANAPTTIAAAHEVVPPGGHVSIGPVEDAVAARPEAQQPEAIPEPPPTGLEKAPASIPIPPAISTTHIPVQESAKAQYQRENVFDPADIQKIDARKFKAEWEAKHGEPLAWNPERATALREAQSFDAYPVITPEGEVIDGRHRIAEAARQGKTVDVAVQRRKPETDQTDPQDKATQPEIGSPQTSTPVAEKTTAVDPAVLERAKQHVLGLEKASTSSIQRALRVGYGQATAILDELEQQRIVGPAKPDGGPRDVLNPVQNVPETVQKGGVSENTPEQTAATQAVAAPKGFLSEPADRHRYLSNLVTNIDAGGKNRIVEKPKAVLRTDVNASGLDLYRLGPATWGVGKPSDVEEGYSDIYGKVQLRPDGTVENLGVAEKYQNKGLAQAMLQAAARESGKTIKAPSEQLSEDGRRAIERFNNASKIPIKRFEKGDRVAWKSGDKNLTGTVTGSYDDGMTRISADQIMRAGGVPIGRIELVHASQLSPIEKAAEAEANQTTAAGPKEPELTPERNPAGTWSIGGKLSIPGVLLFRRKDGLPVTQEDLNNAKQFGPAMAGLNPRTFSTKEEAQFAIDGWNSNNPSGTKTASPAPKQPSEAGKAVAEAKAKKEAARAALRGKNAAPEISSANRTPAANPEPLESKPPANTEAAAAEQPTATGAPASGEPALSDIRSVDQGRTGSGSSGRAGEGELDDTRQPAERPVAAGDVKKQSAGGDYRITEADNIGEGGAKQKIRSNIEAIRTVKSLTGPATPEQQAILAKYVGWGGLPQVFDDRKSEFAGAREDLRSLLTPEEYRSAMASTKNAHFTSPEVIKGMWEGMRHLGLTPGFSELEPSMGVGSFFGLQPESLLPARRTGVELDTITGAIAKALYPDSNIQVTGFEKIALPQNFFDVAIGNVPFGNYGVYDPAYKKNRVATQSIHNYFFVKSLDLVRPGGIVAYITSRYTMDSQDTELRKQMAAKADLLGMVRLPDTAFKGNAGTEVVTDVIFLRKRAPDQAPGGAQFVDTFEVPVGKETTRINEYYAANPSNMLGELSTEDSMYSANSQTLKGDLKPGQLAESLRRILPADAYKPWAVEETERPADFFELGDEVKDGGYTIRDGVVVQRNGNLYSPTTLTGKSLERVKGMIPIKSALRQVFSTQISEAPEKEIAAARKKLNKEYDAFVKSFGPINSVANSRAMGDDPDYDVLAGSLENYDRDKKTAEKTAIFSQRTIEKPKPPQSVEKASEALALSLNETGGISWSRMQELTGKSPEELREELGGLVFQNPEGQQWETADEYLSGNVRKKLITAENASRADSRYQRNVEALEEVQPRDLEPHEIRVTLGAPWIAPQDVGDFIAKTLDLNAKVSYSPEVAAWGVRVNNYERDRVANTKTWGHPDFYANELLEMALNGKSPRVYRDGPDDTRIFDPQATASAQAAQDALKEAFRDWIWTDEARAARLSRVYNDTMNNIRLVEHDGSHLTLPGSNPAIKLRPHQKNVIWRAIKTGNTLFAHEVGAGKTWEMAATAMEYRRLGLAKKPLIAVPNHMAEQFTNEFLQLYPAARLLTVGREDFSAGKRQRAIARIAGGSWDAVIVRHKSFESIPVSDETFKSFIDSQVEELEAALRQQKEEAGRGAEKDKTVKEIQKAIARLDVKLQKRLKRENKDQGATFEQLGVDLIIVDEAHAFKSLPITTRRTRVAGIPTAESDRATDMYMKTQYVFNRNKGKRGVIFATGTPVTNTMAELYNMQRYLQGPSMKEAGVSHFDAWANTFGEIKRGVELDVSGKGFRENERFSKFINIPELMSMYRQFADVRTAAMMKLPRPDVYGDAPEPITAPASPELKAYVDFLVDRAEAIRSGKVDKKEDNMLKVVSEGKKAALDMRLVDPDAEDRPFSKVNKAVANILKIWKEYQNDKATQIIFCDLSTPKKTKKAKPESPDLAPPAESNDSDAVPEAAGEKAGFSVYNDMRDKLVKAGIPEKEIAFIHDFNGDEQKQVLFDAVNSGNIRIVFGSTEKMGVGTNMQRRAIALHHMDTPWRPADVKQRDGRIVRQGNMHSKVHLFQYLTEGSFDAYSWQLLENKASFIDPILSGNVTVREMDDIGMVLPSAAEFKAMASGNPLIKEKIGTDAELGRLDAQRNNFRKQQAGVKSQMASLPQTIEANKMRLARAEKDAQTVKDSKEGFVIGKKKFEGEKAREEAAKALDLTLTSWSGPHDPQQIGRYKGLTLWTKPGHQADSYPDLSLHGESTYPANSNRTSPVGTIMSVEAAARTVASGLIADRIREDLERDQKQLADLKNIEGRTWPHEARYRELVAKKAKLDAELAESEAEKAAGDEAETDTVDAVKPRGKSLTYTERKAAEIEKFKANNGVVLGSGLGALQPAAEVAGKALKDYTMKVVVPKVSSILAGAKHGVETMVHLLAPRAGVPTDAMDEIYKLRGGLEAAEYLLSERLDKWSARVEGAFPKKQVGGISFPTSLNRTGGMTQAEMIQFIDDVKTGTPQPDKELQDLADFLRKMDEELFNELMKLNPDSAYLENHYRVLWKVVPGSQQAKGFKGIFRRPIKGTGGFLKQHTLDTMSEGLALGGVPYSYNPLKMFQASYADAMKYITARKMWDAFKDNGTRVWVKHGKRGPEGYSKFDDPIANVWFKVKQGSVHAGDWWVEDGAARALNNYISRDYIREHPVGRAMLAIKNASTAIELSLSPFHAVFETLEAVGSATGMAFRKLYNIGVRQKSVKAFSEVAKDIAKIPLAPIEMARLGAKAKDAFANLEQFKNSPEGKTWLAKYPEAMAGMKMFFDSGGQAHMSRDFRVSNWNTFIEHWNSASAKDPMHYIAAVVHAIPAFNQLIMSPLFEHYIPNLKVGFFLKEYALAKREYSDRLASGEMTGLELGRKTLDSVENRFGEMNFDNLFWTRTFKTAMQLLFRSVTWKLGNLRNTSSAFGGQGTEFVRGIRGREIPMLDPNMAWLIGMALTTAVIGTIVHRMGTGKWPQTLKDVIYPVIDGATGIRVTIPTYFRDYAHAAHDWKGYITSSLSGDVGRLAEVMQNKDYYGTHITEPDEPLSQRVIENIVHLMPLPFSISSERQAKAQAGSALAKTAGYLGFTKAPKYIEQTKAQRLISELQEHSEGGRTKAQAEHSRALSEILAEIRRGDDPSETIRDDEKKGLINAKDVAQARKQAKQSALLASVKRLSLNDQLKVLSVATPEERKEISRYIQIQAGHARSQPWKWTPQAEQTSKKFFGITPYKTPASIPTPEPIY